jgi:hypothetical protein
MKICMGVPQKTKNKATSDQFIPVSGIQLKEYRAEYNRGTCKPIFFAALFTIAKLWNQHRCLLADERIKKIW